MCEAPRQARLCTPTAGRRSSTIFLDDLAELGAPVVGRGGVVDLVQGAAGDLAAVDAIEAGAGQAQAEVQGVAPHVDQADRRQEALEVVRADVMPARQPRPVPQPRPIGVQLFMCARGRRRGPDLRHHIQIP
jgi:hypothetical protein